MSLIYKRKSEIILILKKIEQYPSTSPFSHEMMSFAYVLVCGAIEFMVESILFDWLNNTIKHHNKSSYRGKKYIQNFLNIQQQAREKNIKDFHSTGLSKIRELIKNIAGDLALTNFNQLFNSYQTLNSIQPDINARLERINRIRHELAHGQKMPGDIQPNVIELKEDFLFVFNHIIKNTKKCLPKV